MKTMRLVMKISLITLSFLLASCFIVGADGIPFDREKGEVTEPHTRLTLTESQRAEYARERKITLTATQLKRLRKLSPSFPKTISEVLSYRYGDCTCCVGHPYAILLPNGTSMAIPHSEADDVSRRGVRQRPDFNQATTMEKP